MHFYKRALSLSSLLLSIAPLTLAAGIWNPAIAVEQRPATAAGTLPGSGAIAQAVTQGNQLLDSAQQQYQQGQLQSSLKTYQQALAAFQQTSGNADAQLRQADGAGTAKQMIGLIYARLGQYQTGLETLQEALKFQQSVMDRAAKADGETALKVFFRHRGKIRSTLSFLGLIYTRLAQYPRALEFSLDALSRSGRGPADYALDGEIFNQLGTIYTQQGQSTQALQSYYRAMVMVEVAGYPLGRDISTGGKPVNVIEANQRIYGFQPTSEREITEFLERSLQLQYHTPVRMTPWARYVFVTTLNNIGDLYRRAGRSQARFFYLKALEASRFTNSPDLEALSLNHVGLGYDQAGDSTQAQVYYQQSLEISRKLGDRAAESATLTYLGASLIQAKKFAQASDRLRASLLAGESLRPGLSDTNLVSLFETQSQAYELLQTSLIAQNQTDAALEIAERGRARAFVELLARRLNAGDARAGTVQPPTLDQIRQVAKVQNATLVEYSVVGDQLLYIWVVSPAGQITFRQVNLQPVLAQRQRNLVTYIEDLRFHVLGFRGRQLSFQPRSPRANPVTAELQTLYQLLIAPIADQLPKEPGARVVFVPQGALFLVPFAALQAPQGDYLIQQYTITISPSIQVLQLAQQGQQARLESRDRSQITDSQLNPSLIVGNPTMPKVLVEAGQPPEQLSDLPGAEAEAKAIAALLKVNPLLRSQATEQTVVQQMPNNRVIHLATHGLLDDFKGLGVPGAIALAPNGTAQPNDGLLTANEILDLKLKANLVVLSACDTGRGRLTGDGVIGLSRSLLSAGSTNVVVSLWAVSDDSTAVLMSEFYRALLQNPDKAIALRQAMLKTLQQYPHPREWAAFVLIGSGE